MTAEFTTGQHIGDYEILSILGMGGMGKVYKVRNVISDRIEAMKILLPDLTSNQGLAERFLREIRLLATLNHPNIAALRTALTYENQLVMIMEFVEGETLANRIARAPISTADAVNYSEQILSALSYAHKQNIIHRDIKPANMMLTPEGAVKLMDFGIARSSSDHALTNTGTTIGSLNYMPPEQVRGESADARSDIYSYGVSLYELLTGQLPFKGDSHYSLMTAHLKEMPAAPITLRSDLPAALNEIIMMAMAKDPAERFQSAEAFRAALKSVPVSGLPVSNTTMATGAPRKSPTMSTAETIVDGPVKRPTSEETLVERSATPVRVPTAPTPARTPAPASAPAMAAAASANIAGPPAGAPAGLTMPSAAVATSGRGLWIALGAILGVGVLIAAGIYIPRRTHTHADPSQSAFPAGTGSAGSVQVPPQTAPPQSTPPPVTPAPPDASGGTGGGAPSMPPSDDTTGGGGTPGAGGGKESASGGGHAGRSGNPKPSHGGQGGSGGQQAAPPVPAGPSPEELAKLEDEGDKLSVRASTASQSVETLRRQQMASGYNLRADIASAAERMQMYVAKGNAALQAKDTANAQKYFDLADTEISKVEKFLGH
jgi:serine/threonine protein kinase